MNNYVLVWGKSSKLLLGLIIAFSLIFNNFGAVFAQTTAQIKIYGHIMDHVSGLPISGAYVDLEKPGGTPITHLITQSNGYYEFEVSPQDEFNIKAAVFTNGDSYTLFRYVPATSVMDPHGANQAEKDFELIPAANVIVYAYDSSGNLIRRAKMQEITFGNLYVSDLQDIPDGGLGYAVPDNFSGWQWDLELPAGIVPLGVANQLHVLWEVPGFGKVMLNIDNQGKGYTLSKQGDYYIIKNLAYEAAVSEYARLQNEQQKFIAQGYSLSTDVSNEIQDSTSNTQAAEAAYANSTPDKPEVTAAANLALKNILTAQEDLALLEAKQAINASRYGDLKIQIIDESGKPVGEATVTFEQTSHDFLFGANPMGPQGGYAPTYTTLLKDAGINYSYLSFSWGDVEQTPGQFDWGVIETYQNLPAQQQYNFKFLGANALWFNRIVGIQFSPLYQDQMTFPELEANVYEHMRTLADHYKDQITLWEIPEQNAGWTNPLNLTWNQRFEIIKTAISGLKAGNPEAKVLVTGNALPYEFDNENLLSENDIAGGISLYEFLNELSTQDIEFDYIGLEFYYSGTYSDGTSPPSLTMASLNNLLDLYSSLGKPIFVRELTAPSQQLSDSTWWHRSWDEATQAEYLKDIYTIAFSKPLVQEIGWSYGTSDQDASLPTGGILDSNLKPKASYYQLQDLLTKQWATSGIEKTSSNGIVEIQGFAGDYTITVTTANGASAKAFLHINERQHTDASIILPSLVQVAPTTVSASKNASSSQTVSWWVYMLFMVLLIAIGYILFLRYRRRN